VLIYSFFNRLCHIEFGWQFDGMGADQEENLVSLHLLAGAKITEITV